MDLKLPLLTVKHTDKDLAKFLKALEKKLKFIFNKDQRIYPIIFFNGVDSDGKDVNGVGPFDTSKLDETVLRYREVFTSNATTLYTLVIETKTSTSPPMTASIKDMELKDSVTIICSTKLGKRIFISYDIIKKDNKFKLANRAEHATVKGSTQGVLSELLEVNAYSTKSPTPNININ